MNMYIAKIIFHININHGEHVSQFDESLRFIEAASTREALEKAREVGRMEECTFINNRNDLVEWKFIDVAHLQSVDELRNGMELYSYTHVEERAGEYIHTTRLLARAIEGGQLILS